MLLKKIRTKGFIGHLAGEAENEFVELDFADKSLWLIQGRNGSGKSTLFDAITMAFYKQHRGGGINFANLVHDKADKAEIFVEFALHGNDYRIAVDMPKKSSLVRRLQYWNGAEWTTKNDEVDDWVSKNLKISYETFVSSVLLRQGEADKFITAKPTPRREIFLELLQLEFYKNLTERAKFRQKCVNDRLKEIKQKLESLENPSVTEIKNQEKLVKEYTKELSNLENEKANKQKELDNAVKAQKLKIEIEKLVAQQKLAAALFENAETVEKKFRYFVELKDNLFRIENVWEKRNEISEIESGVQKNTEKLDKLKAEIEIFKLNLTKNQSVRTKANEELVAIENETAATRTRFDEIRLKVDEIAQIENLESQIQTASEKLKAVKKNIADANQNRNEIQNRLEEKFTEKNRLKTFLQKSETDFQVWTDRLENRRNVVDKDECPTCGNELKSEETRRKLTAEFDEAAQKVTDLESLIKVLSANLADVKKQLSEFTEIQKKRERDFQELQHSETELTTKIETWQVQITTSYETVEREKIKLDFDAIQNQLNGLESRYKVAKQSSDNLEKIVVDLEKTKSRLEGELKNTLENLENLRERNQSAKNGLIKTENQISVEWQTHVALQSEAELENLHREKDELSDIEAEHKHLEVARNNKIVLETQVETLTKQIEEVPETHRREISPVQTEFQDVIKKIETTNEQFKDAESLCRKLTEDKKRFDEKSVEMKAVKEDFEIWKKLFKALGKDGLETKVVREAQHKIRENANKTLNALSNGKFELELLDTGKEMKIFVRDFTTGEQRQVEYCSGGEKFLTAVSLAIAIGQSASGQNIANTLIIDEGFGALDDKNRVLMVNELSRLAEIFQNGRVIIVSHQDDVQENFANRYRLSKNDDGLTSVETGSFL